MPRSATDPQTRDDGPAAVVLLGSVPLESVFSPAQPQAPRNAEVSELWSLDTRPAPAVVSNGVSIRLPRRCSCCSAGPFSGPSDQRLRRAPVRRGQGAPPPATARAHTAGLDDQPGGLPAGITHRLEAPPPVLRPATLYFSRGHLDMWVVGPGALLSSLYVTSRRWWFEYITSAPVRVYQKRGPDSPLPQSRFFRYSLCSRKDSGWLTMRV